MDYITIKCPNCNDVIIISKNELNCCIFRHGIYKSSYQQIDPHLNKQECDRLKNNGLIYGCGRPFKIIQKNDSYFAEKCDYI